MITNVSMLNEPPTCAHYTLSLHDALPIYHHDHRHRGETRGRQLDRFRNHHVLRTSSWAPSTFAARQHQVSVITRAGHPNGKRSPTTAPGARQRGRRRHPLQTARDLAYRGAMLRRLAARAFWALSPWSLQTRPAPDRPTVLVGAPHTSNWDFMLMLAIAWRLGVKVRWLGKDSLFTSWRRPVMRALGGISVDRSAPDRVVADVVRQIRDGTVFALVVTPDGTRKGHSHWKSVPSR